MSSYLDLYRQRIFLDGATEQERTSKRLEKDFSDLLLTSPNKITITLNGSEVYSAILTAGSSYNRAQSEKKVIFYLMTSKSLLLEEGTVFQTKETVTNEIHNWLIIHKDIHSYYGFYKYKVIELDSKFYFIVNGQKQEANGYVNGTGESDLKELFKYPAQEVVELPNKSIQMIMKTSSFLKKDFKIFLGDELWEYVGDDRITIPNVSFITFKKAVVNKDKDSIQEQLPNIDELNDTIIVSNFGLSPQIDLNSILSFMLLKDNKEKESSFDFSNFDETILTVSSQNVSALTEGISELTVTDKVTKFSKTFSVQVVNTLPAYLYVIGSTKLKQNSSVRLTVNTNQTFTLSFDETFIKCSIEGNKINISSQNKIGETSLSFLIDGEVVLTKNFEITSIWV